MNNNYYITSPIYYVNDKPHIGHAYTTIICDVITKIERLRGKNVFFMTGTDEHGQKIQRSAEAAGIAPQDFVDSFSKNFQDLAKALGADYSVFLRTSQDLHKAKVLEVWNKLIKNGNIYLGKYAGWYSIRDEAFYEESELSEDKIAPSGSPVEWVEEECYFFALSKWEKPLLEFYQQNQDFVIPHYRLNEVTSFVKSGLKDLAVSRTGISWGIAVPGDEKHIIYVWLDALTSYISALSDERFWPANAHVVGKDILRFHAVYWPAFLMALGIELPKHIISHGWWTNEGQKISKSVGNVIDPVALIDEFGLDYVRYFLIREITFGSDGNFARANLIARSNNELNNKVGNLCQRVLSFIHKQAGGSVKVENIDSVYKEELLIQALKMTRALESHMKDFAIHLILDEIMHLADEANKYVDSMAPWKLVKEDSQKAHLVLITLLETIRFIAIFLQPFIPGSAAKILDQLNIALDQRSFAELNKDFAIIEFKSVQEPTPIFKRIENVS